MRFRLTEDARPYAVTLGVIATLLVVGGAVGVYALGAGIAAQASTFADQLPQAWHSLVDAIHHRPALAQVVGP